MKKTIFAAWALFSLLPAFWTSAAERGSELIQKKEGHQLSPRIIEPTEQLIRKLKVPQGFHVDLFASGLGAPRMLAVDDDGTVYVTRRETGDVLALRDTNGDGKADQTRTVVQSLPGVHGIAINDGKLYLCTVDAVYTLDHGAQTGQPPRKILEGLPEGGRHPNRTIAFGPDGMLYISVGSTCNCCFEKSDESATILRVRPDGSSREVFAGGLRNTVGFGWHPVTHEMYGMDNGSDWLGDNFPPEELNRLEKGAFYGWPLIGGDRLIELKSYPEGVDLQAYRKRSKPPVQTYTAHAAPIQMAFYTGDQFPEEYRGDAFAALHGSWNREPLSGYEVVRIHFKEGSPASIEPFLSGFLLNSGGRARAFARPAGIAVARDGSLLVGCDHTGVIYRISYQGTAR